jgi:phosphopantetheine--protein transferase-like protein
MLPKIKKIVSEYTRIPEDQLQAATPIGRSAVGNSIVLHRMYAAMAKEGTTVAGYQEIQTYGELENKIATNLDVVNSAIINRETIGLQVNGSVGETTPGVGIDIEEVSNMPIVADCREEEFYKMNFTPAEIGYCIIQPDQYASFAGLFAAKEAILKADNRFKAIPFNQVFIDHLPDGQPVFNGFNISISHVNQLAVAIAIKNTGQNNKGANLPTTEISKSPLPVLLSAIAIILSLIAIYLILRK